MTHIQLAHTQHVHTQLTHTQLVLTQLDIDVHFAWQAWHLATCTFALPGRRGRRGTWRHVSSLGDIDAHFAWQAWHLRHWAGSGGAPGSNDATNGASGRLLTFLAVSLCVFKCSNIHCHFHGSSGAHALASLKTQQKCQVEQGQMYICIWCNSFHGSSGANAIASLKTQQKCSRN